MFLQIRNNIFSELLLVNLGKIDFWLTQVKRPILSNKILQLKARFFLFLNGNLGVRLELPPRPHSLARQESSILEHDWTVEERVFSLIIVAREVLDMKNRLVRFRLHISC